MTQANDQPNDRDILTRIATLEYQVTEIQNTQAQLRATIAPGGYVTDAFERVVERIDDKVAELKVEMNQRFDAQDRKFDSQDSKLDAIIRRLSGMSNLE